MLMTQDVVIFYALIYAVTLVAMIGRLWPRLHRMLHYRPTSLWIYGHPTVGTVLFSTAVATAVLLNGTYWFQSHNYHEDGPGRGHNKETEERWARTFGQVASFTLGLGN
eukprot:SAG31_NODE_3679_length_3994_cov_3.349422_4_plen_109_part_00